MTDLSNDTQLQSRKRHVAPMGEYYTYFAVIFALAVPICLALWAFTALRTMRLPERGPIKSAWSEARIVTPRIFWA